MEYPGRGESSRRFGPPPPASRIGGEKRVLPQQGLGTWYWTTMSLVKAFHRKTRSRRP
jgi:hypothetical protein